MRAPAVVAVALGVLVPSCRGAPEPKTPSSSSSSPSSERDDASTTSTTSAALTVATPSSVSSSSSSSRARPAASTKSVDAGDPGDPAQSRRIRAAVVPDDALPARILAGVTIAARDGRVTLSGKAPTVADSVEIEQRVRRVHGVQKVDNHIVVEPWAKSAPEEGSTP